MKIKYTRNGIRHEIDVVKRIRNFLFPSWGKLESDHTIALKEIEILEQHPAILNIELLQGQEIDLKGKSLYIKTKNSAFQHCNFRGIFGTMVTMGDMNIFSSCLWQNTEDQSNESPCCSASILNGRCTDCKENVA